ncbi:kynureninase [Methylocaldum sp.]|uniref:kynureninase n=1 Tax=Methylocaldum sp. TaxID=1969727 RepID=UPI002D437EC6|nr:kynureninase [Methylocaldum sp.]HYE35191.1 kynureninase [Methylocaldum sp.]
MNSQAHKSFAEAFDRTDVLGSYRNRFHIPKRENGTEEIYFCGNSLGLQPKSAQSYVQEVLEAWAQMGVRGHFEGDHPWLPYHEFATEKLARLVGALPVEVAAMNSLTVNLHLLMVSFYRPTPERHKILIEEHAFPSDRYAMESQITFHGFDPEESLIEASARPGEAILRAEDLLELIEREGDGIALILWPGVQFYTGQAFALDEIAEAGHKEGCVVGFDLAHAAGNLVLRLHDWNADFAVWCSYKYLNAGPGAVAGCFVHERHAERFDIPRFAGWWGHDKSTRFVMPPRFSPLPGAEGWQLSNPPILSLAPLLSSLDLFDQAGMAALRTKSESLIGYLEHLLKERCGDRIAILTPPEPAERGCQLSLRLKDGKRVFESLLASGIVCDWREPDVIRVAPVPFYNRYAEIFDFVDRLEGVIAHAD